MLTSILILLTLCVSGFGLGLWVQRSGYVEALQESKRQLDLRNDLFFLLAEYVETGRAYLELYLTFIDMPVETLVSRTILLMAVEEGDTEALKLLPSTEGGDAYVAKSKTTKDMIATIYAARDRIQALRESQTLLIVSYANTFRTLRDEQMTFFRAVQRVPPIQELAPEIGSVAAFKMKLRSDHEDLKDRLYFMTLLVTGQIPEKKVFENG